jgi:Zn-dependent metalloprotease
MNKRIEINNLSAEQKELTAQEAKKVKGGVYSGESGGMNEVKTGGGAVNIAGHEMTHGLTEFKK